LTTLGLRLAAGGSLRLFGAATLLALLIADGVVTARALDPFRPVVDQLGVAEVEAQRGRREDARRFLIDAERRHARASPPDDLRVRRVMGLWLTLGDPDRAADAVLDAVDRAPGQARIVSLLAGLYLHEGAGRFDRIVDAHRRALAATPDAIVANNLAWLLLHPPAGTPPADAEALRLARDAVASDQERTSALLHTLAVAEARAGDASRVRPLLMRAAALAPDDAPFYRREADRLASAPQSPVASPSP
jgi:Tfp pilus assembly protein PilF